MPDALPDYSPDAAYELLAAVSRNHLALDHRVLHALLDDPARSLPGILRFAAGDHTKTREDLSVDLMNLFAAIPTPDALPFLLNEIRRLPGEIPDEMAEALTRIGRPVLEPLLGMLGEFPEEAGEIAFLLVTLGIDDPRVTEATGKLAQASPEDGQFLEGLYQEYRRSGGALPEPYDEIWRIYPERAVPDMSGVPPAERVPFLDHPSAELRLAAVSAFDGEELSSVLRKRILAIAQADTDSEVRGAAAEALAECLDDTGVQETLLARLARPELSSQEKASLAVALAYLAGRAEVRDAIEQAFASHSTRARALNAMWRSTERVFVPYIEARLLDDPDTEVVREAILAIGHFQLRRLAGDLLRFVDDDALRLDALFAYMLAAPADESGFGLTQLENRLEKLAGDFGEEEWQVIRAAHEFRLGRAGRSHVEPTQEPPRRKAGRNEPCPCGSGKKFKKCCGR